jgi:acetolactate synthase-1/2/3 large subunit
MGIALPTAIAAKLVHPDRHVVTVNGDGGFLMNVQEMETAARLGLPLVVVVWVDGAYGVIGWKQERRFGHTNAIRFGNPDFGDLARAFGWSHRDAPTPVALRSALEEALESREPALVTVPIDYRQNVRLASFGEPALGA